MPAPLVVLYRVPDDAPALALVVPSVLLLAGIVYGGRTRPRRGAVLVALYCVMQFPLVVVLDFLGSAGP